MDDQRADREGGGIVDLLMWIIISASILIAFIEQCDRVYQKPSPLSVAVLSLYLLGFVIVVTKFFSPTT